MDEALPFWVERASSDRGGAFARPLRGLRRSRAANQGLRRTSSGSPLAILARPSGPYFPRNQPVDSFGYVPSQIPERTASSRPRSGSPRAGLPRKPRSHGAMVLDWPTRLMQSAAHGGALDQPLACRHA